MTSQSGGSQPPGSERAPAPDSPAPPRVTVVVPTYNRRASLARLLASLERQTYPRDRFDVVVVDDGSSDGTVDWLRTVTTPFSLRVIEQSHGGPSKARNRGVAEAGGEIVLFLDDDVSAAPDLIAQHIAARAGQEATVVIGPMSPPEGWARPAWVRWAEDTLQQQYRAMEAGEYACSPRQFYTANASVPRRSFLEVGGFDVEYKRNEDVELAYRLRDIGVGFVFNIKADILHYAGHSFEGWQRATYQYGRYDVMQSRDKGGQAFWLACREFHTRHRLNRLAARVCTGRRPLYAGAVAGLGAVVRGADRVGAGGVAKLALSALFSVLYWQGAQDELGPRDPVWRYVAAAPHVRLAQSDGGPAGGRARGA